MAFKSFVFLFLDLVLAVCCFAQGPNTNSLKTGSSAPANRDIYINQPRELDFKTRDAIYTIRESYVAQNGNLVAGNYRPSDAVFGQIENNKPWWGVDGQFCNGQGQHGIDGVSEESRFILNPFILLAVEETQSWTVGGSCFPTYPKPVSLQWYAAEHKAKVTYALSEFYSQRRQIGFPPSATEGSNLYLKNLNARDFGYEFVSADRSYSSNIRRVNNSGMFEDSVQLLSFIHCGGSCGYSGGCNNGSPDEPDLHFNVDKLPATLYCKLWKSRPASARAEADFIFIIDFK